MDQKVRKSNSKERREENSNIYESPIICQVR